DPRRPSGHDLLLRATGVAIGDAVAPEVVERETASRHREDATVHHRDVDPGGLGGAGLEREVVELGDATGEDAGDVARVEVRVVELSLLVEARQEEMEDELAVGLAADIAAEEFGDVGGDLGLDRGELGDRPAMGEEPAPEAERVGVVVLPA